MACKCITMCQKALEDKGSNTRLDVPFSFDMTTGKMGTARIKLATVKADSKKRVPLETLVATFCPICGKRYTPKGKD